MEVPHWIRRLDETDLQFIKRMVLASGSLKQLAAEYDVSYPTIRQRLDRIIERVQLADANPSDDALEARVRALVAENEMSPELARELLELHRQDREPQTNGISHPNA